MIASGLASSLQKDMAYNLSGTSTDTPPNKDVWVDNYGNPMRTNLGEILYFNVPEN